MSESLLTASLTLCAVLAATCAVVFARQIARKYEQTVKSETTALNKLAAALGEQAKLVAENAALRHSIVDDATMFRLREKKAQEELNQMAKFLRYLLHKVGDDVVIPAAAMSQDVEGTVIVMADENSGATRLVMETLYETIH